MANETYHGQVLAIQAFTCEHCGRVVSALQNHLFGHVCLPWWAELAKLPAADRY